MTTELKQAAQQSTLCLQAVCRYISDVLAGDASSSEKRIARTIMHLLPLEQAVPIQQAEAKTDKPAAVRNPFAARCYTMSESHLSGHRLIVGFEKLGDVQDAHEWVARQVRGDFTRPAPSVPADVVRDAEIGRLKAAIARAYGYLWCVNCEPGTPRQYPPERAAYAARKELRDLLTKEQRGAAINAAVQEVHEAVRAESIQGV